MSHLFLAKTPDSLLPQLLNALGASFTLCTLEEAIAHIPLEANARALILSEDQLVTVSRLALSRGVTIQQMLSVYQRLLVYPFGGTAEGLSALNDLVQASVAVAMTSSDISPTYSIADNRGMCGPFSGLRLELSNRNTDRALTVTAAQSNVDFIVKAGGAGLFTAFHCQDLEVFVTSSTAVFDVTEEHHNNLNVAQCFSALVPMLFFLRHCRIPLFEASHRWANWIIDDPNLTPRYGFVRARDLAECVNRTAAAATIAFIPWNYRRTSADVVNLFRANSPRLSICVHGCDHIQSEFFTKTTSEALSLIALAFDRMRQFQSKTSLGYEKVIVFPQGIFSKAAMCGLRQSEMLAAVNTELTDCQTDQGVKAGELLKPAIMSYGGFPLFLRRPPEAPIANFALDLLLGKPCLIVTHHQYFQGGMESFTRMIESLNALDPQLNWTNLEKGIASTCSVRTNLDHSVDVQLYSSRTESRFNLVSEKVSFAKAEAILDRPFQVLWNGQAISYRYENANLSFSGRVLDRNPIVLDVGVIPSGAVPSIKQGANYRFKVAARRYLSEFRDNYVDRFPSVKSSVVSMRNFMSQVGTSA